jgi:hypothetical protein
MESLCKKDQKKMEDLTKNMNVHDVPLGNFNYLSDFILAHIEPNVENHSHLTLYQPSGKSCVYEINKTYDNKITYKTIGNSFVVNRLKISRFFTIHKTSMSCVHRIIKKDGVSKLYYYFITFEGKKVNVLQMSSKDAYISNNCVNGQIDVEENVEYA